MGGISGGGWFVGVHSVVMGSGGGPLAARAWGTSTAADAGGSITTVQLAAPTPTYDIEVGDIIVACVGAGSYEGGSPWTLTADPEWTLVYGSVESDQVFVKMYAKAADQDDVGGTRLYDWTMHVPGGLAGLAVAHITWPKRYGTTLDTAGPRGESSVPSPGGDWQLAFVYERTANNFLQPRPNPVITSPATLLCTSGDDAREGVLRAYISDNEDPITAAYLRDGIAFVRRGLVAGAIIA